MTKPTIIASRGALELASELVDDILREADKRGAPCFRDDLADNRKWVEQKIAAALDEAADGRPLRVDVDGPY